MSPLIWISPIVIALILVIHLFSQLRTRKIRDRERVEDALKHLLDFENQGRYATLESLANSLNLPIKKSTRLITQMESRNLISVFDADLHLTTGGKHWALQVTRAHRLWERYLFDEARMSLQKVHSEAHRQEHIMTETDVDALDASLGHPARDPHGDPIPNRQGTIIQESGTPLIAWPTDKPARIVHLEDEPVSTLKTILAEGLRLGQIIRILQISPERYLLSDGEREYRLAPTVLANVFVVPIPEVAVSSIDIVPLSELAYQQQGEIFELDESVQGFTRRRFLDLGLTPGTPIYPELKNFFGDPRAYRVRGTLIALRRDQAAQVWVKRVVPNRIHN